MIKVLDVYLNEKIIGELIQDRHGQIKFTYSPTWLNDPDAIAISCALPLQKTTFSPKECGAFFSGILPEEHQRKIIAKHLGISADNYFAMLEKIGGECAGAMIFIKAGEKLHSLNSSYQPLSDSILAGKLKELHRKPLLAGEEGIRLSLAGVQDKIAVYIDEPSGRLLLPLYNAPSTHILKPANPIFEGIIFNEHFCLSLARKIGLSAAETAVKKVEDIDYLLIQRYDRKKTNNAVNERRIIRVHQEDLCQALIVPPSRKYQQEGGPSLKQCFQLLREFSTAPVLDINQLMDAVIFNVLIGNCDAHAKNFSLLHQKNIRLAPLYDLVSTIYYKELSPMMAMKVGGEYHADKIAARHFEILADEVGLARRYIQKRVLELIESVITALHGFEITHPMEETLALLIKTRCEHIRKF